MNILFVLHQFLPRHVTGTEQYARSLALGLQARGHKVTVLAYEPLLQYTVGRGMWFEQDEEFEGIEVHRFGAHPDLFPNRELADFENPLLAQIIDRWLDTREFDAIHVFHLKNLGAEALERMLERPTPVVVNLMDFWFVCPNCILLRASGELCDGPPDGGMGCVGCLDPAHGKAIDTAGVASRFRELAQEPTPVETFAPSSARRVHALLGRKDRLLPLLERADAIRGPSEFLRSKFESLGFPSGRIDAAPYGIDASRFHDMPERRSPVGAATLEIGYIGSITPHKGIDVAVRAVRNSEDPRLRLSIWGGEKTHPAYSASLRGAAGEDTRIQFMGTITPPELGGVLAKIDALVVPSLWYENTPFSVLEALYVRLPVVASDLGGMTEIVHDGVNGRTFAAGDAAALGAVFAEYLARPEALLQLSERGAESPPPPTLTEDLDRLVATYEQVTAQTTHR